MKGAFSWPRSYLAAHGVHWYTVAGLFGGFVLIGPLTQWHTRQINPDPYAVNRPLEQLGTLLLVALVGFVAVALPDRSTWLTSASPRRVGKARAGWAVTVTCATTAVWAACTIGLPSSVSRSHVIGIWILVVGMTMLLSCVVAAVVAPLVPILLIALATFGGLPWRVNVFYNPALRPQLWVIALVLAVTGCAAYAWHGEAGTRHA